MSRRIKFNTVKLYISLLKDITLNKHTVFLKVENFMSILSKNDKKVGMVYNGTAGMSDLWFT